jgi:tRNA 2-thiouridine synthesizing protein E
MGRLLKPEELFEFDEDGFLKNPFDWDEDLAVQLALSDGLDGLTEEHWQVIGYLREHYLAHQTLPPAPYLEWLFHMPHAELRRIFSGMREAWRVAGLPNPGEEAKAYM